MNYRERFTLTNGASRFHVEPGYDWKNHRPIFQIWRYDPSACAIYRAMAWPFADCPNFDSFIQAVRYLKENIEELV